MTQSQLVMVDGDGVVSRIVMEVRKTEGGGGTNGVED
jgi:hypothetical protein